MSEYLPYIFIVIGLIGLGIALFGNSRKSDLKDSGIPVDGIVFNQEVTENSSRSFDNYSSQIKDKITIRFVTQSGEWITGDIKQDFGINYTGQYKNGDNVKVYYNRNNPSDFYVDTKQSEFIGKLVFGLAGLVFLAIGLYNLFFI